jgi:predicted RNase H-like HicB family nuclease
MENDPMNIYRYTVVIEPAEEGGYCVFVPALNGLATQGETLEEAREMARDAIAGHLESLVAHGDPIPIESTEAYSQPLFEVMEVSLAQ